MAIFPFIEVDSIQQVNDKLRIDASKSFVGKDEASAVTEVEVEPESGAGFISVFDNNPKNWFLDWEYATDGVKTVTVRVTTDGLPATKSLDITVLTKADDKLFSTDQDLEKHETDILKYVPDGRNTFKYAHRESQTQILEDLYRIDIVDIHGNKLTKDAVLDVEEVKEWSRFLTLQFIFADLSNQIGDIFEQKSLAYREWALESRHKARLKLDRNGDGDINRNDVVDITWRRLNRV